MGGTLGADEDGGAHERRCVGAVSAGELIIGDLTGAHAGCREKQHGPSSKALRSGRRLPVGRRLPRLESLWTLWHAGGCPEAGCVPAPGRSGACPGLHPVNVGGQLSPRSESHSRMWGGASAIGTTASTVAQGVSPSS